MNLNKEQLKKAITKAKNDPVYFAETFLNLNLWAKQKEILQAVNDSKEVAVVSCNASGKSYTASSLVHWWLLTRQNSIVLTTAPTFRQVEQILWREIRNMVVPKFYPVNSITRNKIDLSPKWFALGLSTDKPEAFQGIHSENLFIIVDEACYDEKTEVLTDKGFKFFKDLDKTDKVLSQDKNEIAEFKPIIKIHQYAGEREMYYFKQRGSDFAVTSNHKMLYSTPQVKRLRLKEIKDLDRSGNIFFPRKVNFKNPVENKKFIVKEYTRKCKRYEELIFDFKDWVEFVAWYLSEGCITTYGYVDISQNNDYNPEKVESIKKLLDRMNLKYNYFGGTNFVLSYRQIAKELEKYGKGFKKKRIPQYIKFSTQANLFLDVFTLGDGYRRSNRRIFYTSSKRMADDIQEMLYLIGSAGTMCLRPREARKWHKDHWIETKNDAWAINERIPNSINFKKKSIDVKQHKGTVYCVTTEYGNVFVRRNGRCMWSGNSAISNDIWEAIDGLTFTKMLMIGNPIRNTGRFAEVFKDKTTKKIRISAFDTPNVMQGKEVIKGLITLEDVEMFKSKYGVDSDVYRVRILGKFPCQDTDSFISFDVLDSAINREVEIMPAWEKKLGVDVARFGDDSSVFIVRQDKKIIRKETLSGADLMEVTGKALSIAKEEKILPQNVFIDEIGIGAGVVDRLKEQGWDITPVNVGRVAEDTEHYSNLRAELAFKVKGWLDTAQIPRDDDFYQFADIKYKFNSKGQYQIEKKEDMKKRGQNSPDTFDALALTFASPEIVTYGEATEPVPSLVDELYPAQPTMLKPDEGVISVSRKGLRQF